MIKHKYINMYLQVGQSLFLLFYFYVHCQFYFDDNDNCVFGAIEVSLHVILQLDIAMKKCYTQFTIFY